MSNWLDAAVETMGWAGIVEQQMVRFLREARKQAKKDLKAGRAFEVNTFVDRSSSSPREKETLRRVIQVSGKRYSRLRDLAKRYTPTAAGGTNKN